MYPKHLHPPPPRDPIEDFEVTALCRGTVRSPENAREFMALGQRVVSEIRRSSPEIPAVDLALSVRRLSEAAAKRVARGQIAIDDLQKTTAYQTAKSVRKRDFYNDSSTTAWISGALPVQQSFVTVQMQSAWLQGYRSNNLTFEAISYTSKSSQGAATPITGPTIILTTSQLPAPPPTKLPSKESLMIALPIALGCCALIVFGLFFGMRKHRVLGVGSVYGRRGRGYGERKSRRQRLGAQRGAIRLEERKVAPQPVYRDADEITPAPRTTEQQSPLPPNHGRQESLGSLVDDDEPNAFRRELKAQQRAGR